jgi:hypothetical protein
MQQISDDRIIQAIRDRGLDPTPDLIERTRQQVQARMATSQTPKAVQSADPTRGVAAYDAFMRSQGAALGRQPKPEEGGGFIDIVQAGGAEGMARMFRTIDFMTGMDKEPGGFVEGAQKYFEGVAAAPENQPRAGEEDTFTTNLARAIGNMAAFSIPAIAGGAAGTLIGGPAGTVAGISAATIGAGAAASATGGAVEYVNAYDEVMKSTGDEELATSAGLWAGLGGLTEGIDAALPVLGKIGKVLARADKATGGAITDGIMKFGAKRMSSAVIGGAAMNFAQETGQEVWSDAVINHFKGNPSDAKEILQSFKQYAWSMGLPSALIGGAFGGLQGKLEQLQGEQEFKKFAAARAEGRVEREGLKPVGVVEREAGTEGPEFVPPTSDPFLKKTQEDLKAAGDAGILREVEPPKELSYLADISEKKGSRVRFVETAEGSRFRGVYDPKTGDILLNVNRADDAIDFTFGHELGGHALKRIGGEGFAAFRARIKAVDPEGLAAAEEMARERQPDIAADADIVAEEGQSYYLEEVLGPWMRSLAKNPDGAALLRDIAVDDRSTFRKIGEVVLDLFNDLGASFNTRRQKLKNLLGVPDLIGSEIQASRGLSQDRAAQLALDLHGLMEGMDAGTYNREARQRRADEFRSRRAAERAGVEAAVQERRRRGAERAEVEQIRLEGIAQQREEERAQKEIQDRKDAQVAADERRVAELGGVEAQRAEINRLRDPNQRRVPKLEGKGTRLESKKNVAQRIADADRLEPIVMRNEREELARREAAAAEQARAAEERNLAEQRRARAEGRAEYERPFSEQESREATMRDELGAARNELDAALAQLEQLGPNPRGQRANQAKARVAAARRALAEANRRYGVPEQTIAPRIGEQVTVKGQTGTVVDVSGPRGNQRVDVDFGAGNVAPLSDIPASYFGGAAGLPSQTRIGGRRGVYDLRNVSRVSQTVPPLERTAEQRRALVEQEGTRPPRFSLGARQPWQSPEFDRWQIGYGKAATQVSQSYNWAQDDRGHGDEYLPEAADQVAIEMFGVDGLKVLKGEKKADLDTRKAMNSRIKEFEWKADNRAKELYRNAELVDSEVSYQASRAIGLINKAKERGEIPKSASSVSELNDYVDANAFFTSPRIGDLGRRLNWKVADYVDFTNKVYAEVDKNLSRPVEGQAPETRFSLGARNITQRDRAYFSAVAAGDMETAQRMVDEAAKETGYTQRAYHGSTETDITEFSQQRTSYGFFFSPDKDTADFYSGDDGRLYSVYLNMGKTADLDDEMTFDERDRDAVQSFAARLYKEGMGKNAAVTAFFNGQDGIEEVGNDYTIEQLLSDNYVGQKEIDALVKEIDRVQVTNEYNKTAPVVSEDLQAAIDAYGSQTFYMEYQDDFMRAAENMGYNSVSLADPSSTGEAVSFVVFDPTRIKSADPVTRDNAGNVIPLSQRFGESPDIRYSMGGFASFSDALDDVRKRGDIATQSFRTTFVDYLNETKKLLETATKLPYQKIEAMQRTLGRRGISGQRIRDEVTPRFNKLVDAMRSAGVDHADVADFMRARVQPIAEKVVKERRSKMDPTGTMYEAQITATEAADIMKRLKAQPNYNDIVRVVKMVDDVNQRALDINLASGKIDRDSYDKMMAQYDPAAQGMANPEGFKTFYGSLESMPERSVVDSALMDVPGIGRGVGRTGRPYRGRTGVLKGSDVELKSPVVNAFVGLQNAVIRGVKSEEQRSYAKLVKDLNDPTFAVIHETLPTEDVVGSDGYVHRVPKGDWAEQEGWLPYIENGKWKAIEFKGGNKLIAEDLKAKTVSAPLPGVAEVTRKVASLMTRLDPTFMLRNIPRDWGWAFLAGTSKYGTSFTKAMASEYKVALKDLWAVKRGGAPSGLLKQYLDSGAEISSMGFKNYEDNLADLEKALSAKDPNLATKIQNTWESWVGETNDVLENATRYAAFRAAVREGKSVGEAMLVAKEGVALNFEQTGRVGRPINSAFAFFNAGVNGTDAIIRLLTKPGTEGARARRLAGSVVAMGFAAELLNRMVSEDGDDEVPVYDNISEFEKNRNFLFMRPDGSYFKVPIPFGFNAVYAFGRNMAAYMSGARSAMAAATDSVSFAMESASPFGSGPMLQVISPTLLDPIVQWKTNETFTGSKIAPDLEQFGRQTKAPHEIFWKNTADMPKEIAELVAEATEVGDSGRGFIDFRPDMLEHWASSYMGGVGRAAIDLSNTIGAAYKGEAPDAREAFAVRHFIGEASPYAIDKRYRDMRSEIEQVQARYKQLIEEGDRPTALRWRAANAQLFRASGTLKSIELALDKIPNTPENEERRRTIKARLVRQTGYTQE